MRSKLSPDLHDGRGVMSPDRESLFSSLALIAVGLMVVLSLVLSIMAVAGAATTNFATSKLPVSDQHDRVPFSELGYDSDPLLEGTDPTFAFVVPVTHTLRKIELTLHLRVADRLAPNSTLTIVADRREIVRRTVRDLRDHPTVRVVVPFAYSFHAVRVRLEAHLIATGDTCADVAARRLWIAVRRTSTVDIATAPHFGHADIGAFLDPYGGRVTIVVPKRLDESARANAAALAFELSRINRWRHRDVVVSETSVVTDYRIVVDPGARASQIDRRTMRLSLGAFAALRQNVQHLLEAVAIPRVASGFRETLVGGATGRGVGPLPFYETVALDTLETRAERASLRLILTHDVVPPGARAFVDLYVDGVRASHRVTLHGATRETIDMTLDATLSGTRNRLAIVPTYYPPAGVRCAGTLHEMTFGIDPRSRLRSTQRPRTAMTVSDFMAAAHGRLAFLTIDGTVPPIASRILNALGSINTRVTSVDFRPLALGARAGDDAVIVLDSRLTSVRTPVGTPVRTGRFDGVPALYVVRADGSALRAIDYAALRVARGAQRLADSRLASAARKGVRTQIVGLDRSYAEHLRRHAVPSLAAFTGALTFMIFLSRKRERT